MRSPGYFGPNPWRYSPFCMDCGLYSGLAYRRIECWYSPTIYTVGIDLYRRHRPWLYTRYLVTDLVPGALKEKRSLSMASAGTM